MSKTKGLYTNKSELNIKIKVKIQSNCNNMKNKEFKTSNFNTI